MLESFHCTDTISEVPSWLLLVRFLYQVSSDLAEEKGRQKFPTLSIEVYVALYKPLPIHDSILAGFEIRPECDHFSMCH